MAEIDKGTMAAVVPMEVPATSRVKGMSATSRMMKGNERKPFTTAPISRLREGAGTSPPRPVTTSSTPRGRPSSRVARLAAPTMARVSTVESMKSSMSWGDMAENLHVGCAVAQESDDVVERHRGDRRQGQHQHAERRVLDVIDGALDDAGGDVEPARQPGDNRTVGADPGEGEPPRSDEQP